MTKQPIDPTILDLLKEATRNDQSPEFKQRMHQRIQSRIAEDKQQRRTGLDFYLRRVLIAIPVMASLAVVFTLIYLVSSVPNVPDTTLLVKQTDTEQFTRTKSAVKTVKNQASLNDPELQEIIALAFAFEAESNNNDTAEPTIKTAASVEELMILAYLRE